jgi:pimeloyl-ACP methyl ester carboxylesterase
MRLAAHIAKSYSKMKTTFAVFLTLVFAATAHAFVVPRSTSRQQYVSSSSSSSSKLYATSEHEERIDVVLFGIGDLRVDDHGGLQAALKEGSSKILPLVVLDPTTSTSSSMMSSHAMDTTAMISAAVSDLQTSLLQDFQLDLQVSTSTMEETLQQLHTLATSGDDIHIHVCDLDKVDNKLGYGPYSSLSGIPNVHAWTCHLREEPWISKMKSDLYTDYEKKFQKTTMVQPPIDTPRQVVPEERRMKAEALPTSMSTTIPTPGEFLERILRASSDDDIKRRCLEEQGTGLFGTHWGGLPVESTIGERKVWQTVQDYCLTCQEDDSVWAQHVNYVGKLYQRKATSLEHASMEWMLKNSDSKNNNNNWLAGESMTRYLAAPLWLGTISPRRLAQAAAPPSSGFHTSAMQRLVEGREWHKLLACHNMENSKDDSLEYDYWRWHGFLCRYAKKNLTESKTKKDALLLVHGFGASSTQWQRSIDALTEEQATSASASFDQVLAPDLIGFGQCEKPALTYTQYLWSGFVNDFAKEIGICQESWDSFVVGGNSIGGYTSMTVAADDSVQVGGEGGVLSSMGSPGSNRCSGLTLFNSAGNIRTKEEIVALQQEMSNDKAKLQTVAQLTATDGLPPCSPPPRPVARLFGNALLTYLRPNIGPICKKVYPVNPDAADENLAQNILRDSLDPGAVNVMISGSKLPIPRTANELLGSDFGSALDITPSAVKEGIFKGPVLVAQGMLDPLNDAKGRAAMLGALRDGITVSPINGGHCPHDEMPQECMRALLQWTEQQQTAAASPAVASVAVSN